MKPPEPPPKAFPNETIWLIVGGFLFFGALLLSQPPAPTTQTASPVDNLLPCAIQGDCRCSDFVYQQDAMVAIEANPKLSFRLDRDQDGYHCESLPSTGDDDP